MEPAVDQTVDQTLDQAVGQPPGVSAAGWALAHEIRLRGAIAEAAAPAADELLRAGLAETVRDRVALTVAGRDAHARWARAEPGPQAVAAEAAYEAFKPIDQRFLRTCHDWQIGRGGIPNDHTDPAYDDRVIARLHSIDRAVGTLLDGLVGELPRFDRYRPRFAHAVQEVDGGGRQWFASPACDSYHTVWMQLHEDLLAAVGRTRADEAAG